MFGDHQAQSTNLVANSIRRAEWTARCLRALVSTIASAAELASDSLRAGGKILVAGNGGSAADAQHFAAEFTGRMMLDRRALPAIALTTDTSALTALANDYGYASVFSRQIEALGRPGDVLFAISTSGRSQNIVQAAQTARAAGISTVALAGAQGFDGPADIEIRVPSTETPRIQEAHCLILHAVAQAAETTLAEGLESDPTSDSFPFLLRQDELASYRSWIEQSGQTLVTTNGCFDGMHAGHAHSLGMARVLGDRLVVAINDDDSVRRLKGPSRPLAPLSVRLDAISACPAVDHAAVITGDDPSALLVELRPHVHCKGEEYRDMSMPEAAVVRANGGSVQFLPRVDGVSTTQLLSGTAKHQTSAR